jgi:hypothetical protein
MNEKEKLEKIRKILTGLGSCVVGCYKSGSSLNKYKSEILTDIQRCLAIIIEESEEE